MFQACKDLLFPACCPGCGLQLPSCRQPLCHHCLPDLAYITSPQCSCCGVPFPSGQDHLCGDCLQDIFSFDLARSVFLYRQPVNTLLTRFKFGGQLSSLDNLSVLVQQADTALSFEEPDLILPVPLHISRLRNRGFNQSLLIARSCFQDWRAKIRPDLLQRHQATIPQTSLSGKARRNNLKGAFTVNRPGEVDGRNVLLVDDILTTGSTVDECAKVLRKAGAKRIEIFTIARAI